MSDATCCPRLRRGAPILLLSCLAVAPLACDEDPSGPDAITGAWENEEFREVLFFTLDRMIDYRFNFEAACYVADVGLDIVSRNGDAYTFVADETGQEFTAEVVRVGNVLTFSVPNGSTEYVLVENFEEQICD